MAKECAIIIGASSVGLELTQYLFGKGWEIVMTDIKREGGHIALGLGRDVLWVQRDIADLALPKLSASLSFL